MKQEYDPLDLMSVNETGKYSCPRCKNTYSYRATLKRHLNECGQEPMFKCPFCPHKSKRNANLQGHIANVHGIGKKEKPFKQEVFISVKKDIM